MRRSLILGGTRGLGRSLALRSAELGIEPIVVGRKINQAATDQDLLNARATMLRADLSTWNGLAEGLVRLPVNQLQAVSHVFWVAGIFQRKPLLEATEEEVRRMVDTHLVGPIGALTALQRLMSTIRPLAEPPGQPYHLVTIASTSSWRLRQNEALYCALKAAKAHLARNYAQELVAGLPGSKVTLINPGGIKTGFWDGVDGQAMDGFMDPDDLAKEIWGLVTYQREPFQEYQIPRDHAGRPDTYVGPSLPETP